MIDLTSKSYKIHKNYSFKAVMMINDSSGSWVIMIQNYRYQRCDDSILILILDCSNEEQPIPEIC